MDASKHHKSSKLSLNDGYDPDETSEISQGYPSDVGKPVLTRDSVVFDPLLGNRRTTGRCIRHPSHQSSLSVPRFHLLTGSQGRKQVLFLCLLGALQ